MEGFLAFCVGIAVVFSLGWYGGSDMAERNIWEACVSKHEAKFKETTFACKPVAGTLNGQPIAFPDKP